VYTQYMVCLFVLFFWVTGVMAAAPENTTKAEEAPASAWGGEAEIGILITRGNTHTDSQNIKLGVHYTADSWQHKLRLESLRTEDNGVVSADRFGAFYRSTYQFSTRDFAYGDLRYEKDRFAGFDRRTAEVIGYGRKLYTVKPFLWDVEVGVGARQTDRTDNTKTDEGVVRLATNLEWKISETSALKEELFVEKGSANTLTQSTTSLKLKINSSLAMKLGLKVIDNSDVPIGKKHTDTETALTLVYDF
jgi:putative salt-induced outer membrane protein